MNAKTALAIMCVLRVWTVAYSELHSSLLMRAVCCASGVYSGRPRFSLVHVHPRYRGTPPQTPPTQTLLVKSQICRKQLGYATFETQKDRDLAPVNRTLATVEITLL